MTDLVIAERVRTILGETLELDEVLITTDANLLDDLGADSLIMLEVLARLDGEFGINIEQSQLARMTSLGVIVEIVRSARQVGA